jgi:hypothetical protein
VKCAGNSARQASSHFSVHLLSPGRKMTFDDSVSADLSRTA